MTSPANTSAVHTNATHYANLIAVIPAAGQAKRVAPLPCSKELFPVSLERLDHPDGARPKVVCHYLLEKMRMAGAEKAFIIVREGKWDILKYCGDGSFVRMHLAYLMMGVPFGPPYSVDQAYPFMQDAQVLFGFPDILFHPDDVFVQLLSKQTAHQSDVVLALFPAHDHRHMDMVDIENNGRVRGIYLKPSHTNLRHAWICAVWSRIFSEFLHAHLQGMSLPTEMNMSAQPTLPELSMGHVFQAALELGLHIQSVIFPQGSYLDIGTPEGLYAAMYTAFRGSYRSSSP